MALIHQWLLDETSGTTVADSVGSNTGTFTAGTLTPVGTGNGPGGTLADAGLDFTEDAIGFSNVPLTGAFALCAWVKADAYHDGYIFDLLDASTDGISLILRATAQSARFRHNSTVLDATSTHAINTWFHLAVTYSGTVMRVFYDGVQVGTFTKSFGTTTSITAGMRVGARGAWDGAPWVWFNGKLADLRIYDSDESANLAAIMDLDGGGTDELTASGVDAGSPDSPTPSVGQIHDLGAGGVDSPAPVAYSGPIGQIHALSEGGVDAGTPDSPTPLLGQDNNLTATGVDAGSVALDRPAIDRMSYKRTQNRPGVPVRPYGAFEKTESDIESLTATGITSGAPDIDEPSLNQKWSLATVGLDLGVPTLGMQTLFITSHLIATGVDSSAVSLGMPRVNPPSVVLPIYYLRIMQ